MKDQITTKLGFAGWFRKLVRNWRPASVQLDLRPPATKRSPEKPASTEPLPGNYHFLELFLEITLDGVTYLAQPRRAIRDTGKTPPVLVWGTPLHFSFPNPAMPRMRWIDDPKNGVSRRLLTSPEDLLGAEGLFGGRKYHFEKILQVTQHQVVYSLLCDENQSRLAYALPREQLSAANPSAKTVN
jgi:hypothetical protein